MKYPLESSARTRTHHLPGAFTLTETVIAIGVLAVLLTGFIAVFTPAAQGIRRAISSEQADRLTTTLEMELVTLRTGQKPADVTTGFAKAFRWIQEGNTPNTAVFVYQYRGDPTKIRPDGTPDPMLTITGEPGKDYIVQSMARRLDDDELENDLKAIEGSVFFVKPTQLVYENGELVLSESPAAIKNADGSDAGDAPTYKEAVIAFSAEFHSVPTKTMTYLSGPAFATRFNTANRPIFTRNLAVRR